MSEAPLSPEPAVPPARPRGTRRRFLSRWTKRLLALGAAVIATIFLTIFTVDIGNIRIGSRSLRSLAETQARNYLERTMTIGRISAYVSPGKFGFEDVVIQGLTPEARPFFRAKKIDVKVEWWSYFTRRELVFEVTLSGWEMFVEAWEGGRHNMPKLTPKPNPNAKPRTFVTTVRYIFAKQGEFTYQDHATPWSVVCRNLDFELVRSAAVQAYVGKAQFTNGTVQIQSYLPMRADMTTRFALEGRVVRLQHIDLKTDGATTHVNGYANFANWPESTYNVNSTVDFPTMRSIFFAREKWELAGEAEFSGIFKLFKDGANLGRELRGDFRSHEARVRVGSTWWTFPELHGSLEWLRTRFAVTHADSEFLGGQMQLDYALAPFGQPGGATATFNASYQDVDVREFTRMFDWQALQPDGRMAGSVGMSWPNGRFSSALEGNGETTIVPAGGVANAAPTLPPGLAEIPPQAPFDEHRPYGRFPLGGHMAYRFSSEGLEFSDSWASTPATYVTFSGRALGGPVHLPFHVTSHDWQESDRLFTAIMGQFTGPTAAIEVGGRGTFDGVLTESFRTPRIEGHFASEHMRAFDMTWGRASADLVIENGFMDIAKGVVAGRAPDATIRTDGRYSLGYKPGLEEMNAHVRVEHWPLADFRHVFELEDWPVEGTLGLADLQLRGPYKQLKGTGQMRLDQGTAWKEPFEMATGDLVFEGDGLRINRITMAKATGHVLGNAWIGWADNTYSFTANGQRIPVEALQNFQLDIARLTGTLQFTANGAGSFDAPTYEFDGQIADLYAGDEGIGQVRAHLTVRENVLTIDRLDAASDRLQVFGSGSIALNDSSDAQLLFRFFETSLDPYLKFFAPEVSPYARAIATGSVSVRGPLAAPADLTMTATVDEIALTLLDYALENDEPVTLVFEENAVKIPTLGLVGADTKLDIAGLVDIGNDHAKLDASGQANLAILQLFYPDLSAGGSATVQATLEGPLDPSKLALRGRAQIAGGRLKPGAFPQGLSEINGPIVIDAQAIRIDGLRGVIGGGTVEFGGQIALAGYRPTTFDLRADGQAIRLRYPLDVRSTVGLDLRLTGPVTGPRLAGTIDVLEAEYAPRIESEAGILGFAAGGVAPVPDAPPFGDDAGVSVGLDIVVRAQRTAFIDNDQATIYGTALFDVGGTIAQPAITGQVDILGGEWTFGGQRYFVRQGSIRFDDPRTLEPFFDIEANTRVRVPGETFYVTLRFTGSLSKFTPTLVSEPALPEFQIIQLLLGEAPDFGAAELQARSSSQELQARAISQAMAVLLTSPISSRIGDVFERLPIDSVEIIPLLGNDTSLQRLDPTARVVFGTRLSNRVYLTYSRTLNASQYEVILLEFDQNDRVSWVLSRNEDRTFALDFRIRYVF